MFINSNIYKKKKNTIKIPCLKNISGMTFCAYTILSSHIRTYTLSLNELLWNSFEESSEGFMDSKKKGMKYNNQRKLVGTVAQHPQPPLGKPTSRIRRPGLSSSYSMLPNVPGQEQMMAQYLCSCHPYRRPAAPGFGLASPWLLWAFVVWTSRWETFK